MITQNSPVSEGESTRPGLAERPDPKKNPSYPARVHTHEKAHWQQVLAEAQAKVAPFRQRMGVLGDDPKKATYERLFAQMLGAVDQIADAVRRLPAEVGDLYEEDKHRVEEALAALERTALRW